MNIKNLWSLSHTQDGILLCTQIGSVYLSKNAEIGIFLKKEFQAHNIGKKVLEMIIQKNPRKRYLANINPKNTKSIKFFKKNHFKLIQYTFELEWFIITKHT